MKEDVRNLRVSEVSRRTGLSVASVRRMIHLKMLPVVRIGRTVAIPEKEVNRMIQEGYTPTANRGATVQSKLGILIPYNENLERQKACIIADNDVSQVFLLGELEKIERGILDVGNRR